MLAEQLVSTLLDLEYMSLVPGPGQPEDLGEWKKERDSARWCLCTWLLWLWSKEYTLSLKKEDKAGHARRIISSLIAGDQT
jgi:hypothetical protein